MHTHSTIEFITHRFAVDASSRFNGIDWSSMRLTWPHNG